MNAVRGSYKFVAAALVVIGASSARTASAQGADAFNPGANAQVLSIGMEASGSMIVGGMFTTIGGGGTGTIARARLARLSTAGVVDDAFNPGANDVVRAIAVLPNGQMIVAGAFTALGGGTGTTTRQRIGRINADGTVDAAFDPGANGTIHAIAIQNDGKILVGGEFTTIGGGGTGSTPRSYIARLEANGSVDAAFNPGANGFVRAFAIGFSDQIYVGGDFTTLAGASHGRVGRLNANGTNYAPFNIFVPDTVFTLAVQGDTSLVIGGAFASVNTSAGFATRWGLARVHQDSSALDTAFDPGANGAVYSVAIQAGGQMIVTGTFIGLGGGAGVTPRSYIGRINADGSVDTAFNPGANAPVYGVAIQRDGAIIVGGLFTAIGGGGAGIFPRAYVGRLAVPHARSEYVEAPQAGALGVPVTWQLDTDGPLLNWVEFAWSTDGITYTTFGSDVDPDDRFSVANPVLPLDPNMRVRARGVARTGFGGGSQSVYQIEAPVWWHDAIENRDFSAWPGHWLTFDQPLGSGMVSNVTDGVFQFQRTGTQAVVFQPTGLPAPAHSSVKVEFVMGNSDTVRKRFSVLLHDEDFSDLQVCTFWLPPSAPLALYKIETAPTKDWKNLTVSFYAASTGNGGFYRLDNVSLYVFAGLEANNECRDPWAPTTGGATSGTLLANGLFTTNIDPWLLYGQINGSVAAGEFRFTSVDGTPSGVVFQPTGQSVTASQFLTADFMLGNFAGRRARVTVLIHDLDFSDLAACTFWLEPLQPLRSYSISAHATEAWTNATISVYPATVLPAPFIRLDNVSLALTPAPGAPPVPSYPPYGTQCHAAGVVVPDP